MPTYRWSEDECLLLIYHRSRGIPKDATRYLISKVTKLPPKPESEVSPVTRGVLIRERVRGHAALKDSEGNWHLNNVDRLLIRKIPDHAKFEQMFTLDQEAIDIIRVSQKSALVSPAFIADTFSRNNPIIKRM